MNNLASMSVLGRLGPAIYFFALLDVILKGVTLFKSAQRGQKVWFVALFLINSLGILPLIYLIVNKDVRLGNRVATSRKAVVKKSKKSKR